MFNKLFSTKTLKLTRNSIFCIQLLDLIFFEFCMIEKYVAIKHIFRICFSGRLHNRRPRLLVHGMALQSSLPVLYVRTHTLVAAATDRLLHDGCLIICVL